MNQPTCGGCFFWEHVKNEGANLQIGAPKRGLCWGGPPTPYVAQHDKFGGVRAQGNLRAVTAEGERACAVFVDREQIEKLAKDAEAQQHGRLIPPVANT